VSLCLTTTAAWADDDEDYAGDDAHVVQLDGDYTPQDVCNATLPATASGFTATPTVTDDTGWVNDGAPVRANKVGNPVPTGTASASSVLVDGSAFRNGGSPNLWGMSVATLTYPNSTQEYTTVQHLIETVTVSCYVHKTTRSGHLVVPPGLQTTGNAVVGHDQTAGPNDFDTNNGPLTFTGQPYLALICISPGKKGGQWTGKNGFPSASCAAASLTASQWIPSGNIPVE
jgi:hypothetical protein